MNALPTLLYYCHHSTGIGHLVRSFNIVRELSSRFRTVFLSGGEYPQCLLMPPGIEFIQLPLLEVRQSAVLLPSNSSGKYSERVSMRRRMLLAALEQYQPAIIVTELFPFGRFQFTPELIPFLRAAKQLPHAPLIVSSVRDILEPNSFSLAAPKEISQRLLHDYYDAVLVHSDPNFVRLETFSPWLAEVSTPMQYTGYVVRRAVPQAARTGSGKVVASVGGGKMGAGLLRLVLEAFAQYGFGPGRQLKVIGGPLLNEAQWTLIAAEYAGLPNLEFCPSVPDLLPELNDAAASISQGGYNTVMEVFAANCPAVVVPFSDLNNREQIIRCELFASKGMLQMLPADASPSALAAAVQAAIAGQSARPQLNLDGAARTAALLAELCLAGREKEGRRVSA